MWPLPSHVVLALVVASFTLHVQMQVRMLQVFNASNKTIAPLQPTNTVAVVSKQQRLVVFASPHKVASSSVEHFYFDMFSHYDRQKIGLKPLEPAFVNWTLPPLKDLLPWEDYHRGKQGPNPKQYSYAMSQFRTNSRLKAAVLKEIAHEYATKSGINIFLLAEGFGGSNKEVIPFIKEIASIDQTTERQVVIVFN